MAWDQGKSIQYLNAHAGAKSRGFCARFVRQAISAGGLPVPPIADAKNLGRGLIVVGFEQVIPEPSNFKMGDVAVIQPATGHPHGHVAMFNGTEWVSDFRQKNGLYPGKTYREEKPEYVIYRFAD